MPYLLLAPQLAITLVFFYWPASQALYQSVLKEDPFGLRSRFVWFDNFKRVLSDPNYLNSVEVTVIFSAADRLLLDGDRAAACRHGRQGDPRPRASIAR